MLSHARLVAIEQAVVTSCQTCQTHTCSAVRSVLTTLNELPFRFGKKTFRSGQFFCSGLVYWKKDHHCGRHWGEKIHLQMSALFKHEQVGMMDVLEMILLIGEEVLVFSGSPVVLPTHGHRSGVEEV